MEGNPMSDKPRLSVKFDAQNRAIVTNTHELHLAAAAGYKLDQIAIGQPDREAIEKEVRAGWEDERASLTRQIASDPASALGIRQEERERILGIQALTERGFEGVAREAIDKGSPVETFVLAQMREIKDRGITLSGIGRDAPPVAPNARPPAAEANPTADHAASWDRAFEKTWLQVAKRTSDRIDSGKI
jgi:hypothetical protein